MFKLFLAICSVVCFLYQGCHGVNTISGNGSQAYTHVGDVFLNAQITVTDIRFEKASDPPRTKVHLMNNTGHELVIEVKMDFYDESGVKIDNPWGWKPLTLESNLDEWVEFTAPNKNAASYRLAIQYAGK